MKSCLRGTLFLVALALLILLVGPFLVRVPPLEGTVPPEQLADPDSRFVEVDGLKIHYKTAGQGEPVWVLLHGFPASVYTWREVLAPLGEHGRVIAFDRPAFGLTERPLEWDGLNPYSPEAQAALTTGLMDALGVERAILVGNSAGGAVAVQTALEVPERVQALVLVNPALDPLGGRLGWLRPLLHTPQMDRLGPVLARTVQAWGAQFGRAVWHDPARLTPEIWAGYTRPLKAENWDRALWELALAYHPMGLSERLDALGMPALVVAGAGDRVIPAAQSLRLAGELPDARLVVLSQCGHLPQEECPGPFLEALAAFLQELQPAGK
jgi:pimeloyl-ACP methyl ester carboxylesterase